MYQLLDSLLDLQDTLSSRWKEGAQDDATQETSAASQDEEILSDSEGEGGRERERVGTEGRRRKRKRPSSAGGRRDYEKEISQRHEELRPHWNTVLSKWDEKTKLSSGKITNKVGWIPPRLSGFL